jgi:hypothetical protein
MSGSLTSGLACFPGILAIGGALREGSCALKELRLGYQRGTTVSHAAEMELAQAVEASSRLLKLGFEFRQRQSRELVEKTLMRNRDAVRRARLNRQASSAKVQPAWQPGGLVSAAAPRKNSRRPSGAVR